MRDLIKRIAGDLNLTDEERALLQPSGGSTIIANRVHWAKAFLKHAGLVEQPAPAHVQITERGKSVLAKNPAKIDAAFLKQFLEFVAFQTKASGGTASNSTLNSEQQSSSTPEERIDIAFMEHNAALRDALLQRVLGLTPTSFERMIIDVLRAVGYGGFREGAGEHLGKPGDGGVDGVIYEDKLGLGRIYLQAKLYKPGHTVGAETVQAFIGALVGKGAQKGVLITTSTFSEPAKLTAEKAGSSRIVLIDGDYLTDLMIQTDVGVRKTRSVDLKQVNTSFFEEDEPE